MKVSRCVSGGSTASHGTGLVYWIWFYSLKGIYCQNLFLIDLSTKAMTMPETYKTEEGERYFITFSVVNWIDVFIRREYQDILVDNITHCQGRLGLELYTYCIMPSHVHMIASRTEGRLGDLLRSFKSHTSKKLKQAIQDHPNESRKHWIIGQLEWFGEHSKREQVYQFWQHGYHPFALYSNKLIKQKEDYIHNNPVKAGFVTEPEHWRLSSASPYSPIEIIDN